MTAALTVWNVLLTTAIMGGIVASVAAVCLVVFAIEREKRGRPLLPWGARARVERSRAAADISEHETRREAMEIMRLSLEPRRARVLQAIEAGELADPDDLPALGAGSPAGDAMRDSHFFKAST